MKRKAAPAGEIARLVLKSGKEQSVKRFHPWIFSGAIKKIYGDPADGDPVRVYDNKDNLLCSGHYSNGSIAVRILRFGDGDIDDEFFFRVISNALRYRKNLGFGSDGRTTMYRMIHGEGDGLPGLIADYYDGVAVLQFHSPGMYRNRDVIVAAVTGNKYQEVRAVWDKSENTLSSRSGLKPVNSYIFGESQCPLIVRENGFAFEVDWINGQKTGFFIDQRENRLLSSAYSKGRRVLNLFSYTGGFSVYCMNNAHLVHSVDSSAAAVELAKRNVDLNFRGNSTHEAFCADAFEFLSAGKHSYDMIIIDPPAFAKHNNVLGNALQGYKRLNQKAIENIMHGGILFTFSCSQVVSRDNFRKSVFAAAASAGRSVRILHQMSQPADHPVNIFHPESEYLKGLVLYIE